MDTAFVSQKHTPNSCHTVASTKSPCVCRGMSHLGGCGAAASRLGSTSFHDLAENPKPYSGKRYLPAGVTATRCPAAHAFSLSFVLQCPDTILFAGGWNRCILSLPLRPTRWPKFVAKQCEYLADHTHETFTSELTTRCSEP